MGADLKAKPTTATGEEEGKKNVSFKGTLTRFGHSLKEVSSHTTHAVKWWHILAIAILFTILLWSMIFLVRIDSRKCTIDQAELNDCARGLSFFSTDRKPLPRTEQQLDEYCHAKSESIGCVKRYTHSCVVGIDRVQRRYVKKFVRNYRRQLDQTCLRTTERNKFMLHATCLSNTTLNTNATRCTASHRRRLLYIAQHVQDDMRIAAACCSLHLRHECLSSTIARYCDRSAVSFAMDQIENPYRSLIGGLCAPYYMSVRNCKNRIDPDVWGGMRKASTIATNDDDDDDDDDRNDKDHHHHHHNDTNHRDGNSNIDHHHNDHHHDDEEEEDIDHNSHDDSHHVHDRSETTTTATPTIHETHPHPHHHRHRNPLKFQESFLATLFIIRRNN